MNEFNKGMEVKLRHKGGQHLERHRRIKVTHVDV